MIDLVASTMVQLKAEFARLAVVVSESETDRKQIWAEIGRRKAKAAAKASVNTMDNDERAALKDYLA